MEHPDFRFPFTPYPVQLSFMKNLFSVIEDRKLGIFESPTGTGKSLSIICGALTWLKHHKLQHKLELEKTIAEAEKISRTDTAGSLDWFTAAAQKHETSMLVASKRVELKQICDFETKVANTLARARNLKKGNVDARRRAQSALNSSAQTPRENEEDELLSLKTIDEGDEHLIDDYVSDEESSSDKKDIFEDEYKDLQIIFCSRTHSQLSQFVREVQRSAFASEIRLVCLASRAVMCINPNVKKLASNSMINDRCLELQKSKSQKTKTDGDSVVKRQKQKHSSGCEFHSHQLERDLRDLSLSDPHDIEELLTLAKDRKACPYYAARFAVNEAELLIVPYQTLLHKATREACGLNLKDNVVIIDEAHNLLETISQIHSVVLTGIQVSYTHSQLLQYSNRYKTKLSAKNMLYVKQLLFVLNLLSKLLINKAPTKPNEKQDFTKIWQVGDFLVEARIDNVNLFKMIEFCKKTSLPQKLYGFRVVPNAEKPVKTSGMSSFLVGLKTAVPPASKEAPEPASETTPSPMQSPLFVVLEFLQCLIAGHEDGRVLCSPNALPNKASLKYLLLNPASHFKDVLEEARSVVVAGGTMQPVSQFEHQLFGLAGADPERVAHFTYGHVIPDSHVLPIVLTKGPSGKTLDFTYTSRNDPSVMDEMGQSLLNLCNIVKGGVVCFFPSYDYEELVSRRWKETKVWERLEKRKKIFREPKETSQVEQILKKYADCIENCRKINKDLNGSLLLSVVGGKMSEGINFTDDLCRCVVMIGMPYPNKHSVELKEKMDYLDKHLTPGGKGTSPGAEHYQSLCMKAVNQSIGRAIRHRNDYATIILADHRYGKPSSIHDLPSWINKRIHNPEKFGDVMAMVRQFFASKC